MSRSLLGKRLGNAAGTALLLLMFGFFVVAHATSFIENPRLSVALIVVFDALIILVVLMRQEPRETWHSWWTWATTFGGTMAPSLLRPVDASTDLFAGDLLQVIGLSLQIAAILSLNRSFGLLPAHREIKSEGMYRWVRHPLYLAYSLAQLGYVINNPSVRNFLVYALVTALQVLRILNEESFLSRYPAYMDYARRTRWRLVPLVW